MASVKETVRKLIERLPDDCTWDDVMNRLYVCQKIDAGIRDVEAGRTTPHDEVFAEYEA
jgi:predicted transcriptional regulator